MPALSQAYRESGTLAASFRTAQRLALPACLVAALSAAALAPAFFEYLYDDRYAQAGWIAQLALLRFWFEFLRASTGVVLLASGNSRTYAASNAVRALAVGLGCYAGFELGGLPGVLIGTALGALCGHLVVVVAIARMGVSSLDMDIRYTLIGLLLGAGGLWAPRLVAANWGGDVPLLTLLWSAVFVGPFAFWVALRLLRERRA